MVSLNPGTRIECVFVLILRKIRKKSLPFWYGLIKRMEGQKIVPGAGKNAESAGEQMKGEQEEHTTRGARAIRTGKLKVCAVEAQKKKINNRKGFLQP